MAAGGGRALDVAGAEDSSRGRRRERAPILSAKALDVPVTALRGETMMNTCSNRHCQRRERDLDDEGMCPRCRGLAARFRSRVKEGALAVPDFTGTISHREAVPAIPEPSRAAKCSACEEGFADIGDQAQELSARREPLYLHHLCREILMRL